MCNFMRVFPSVTYRKHRFFHEMRYIRLNDVKILWREISVKIYTIYINCKNCHPLYTSYFYFSKVLCRYFILWENDMKIANTCVERENVRLSYIDEIFIVVEIVTIVCVLINICVYKVQVSSMYQSSNYW